MSGRDAPTRYSARSSIVASDKSTPYAKGSPEGGLDSELERDVREAFCSNEGATVVAGGVVSEVALGNEGNPAAGDANAGGPPMMTLFISTSPLRRLPDREEGAKGLEWSLQGS